MCTLARCVNFSSDFQVVFSVHMYSFEFNQISIVPPVYVKLCARIYRCIADINRLIPHCFTITQVNICLDSTFPKNQIIFVSRYTPWLKSDGCRQKSILVRNKLFDLCNIEPGDMGVGDLNFEKNEKE